jgi:hypothetical protein
VFFRLRRAYGYWQFNRIIADILKTKPIATTDSNLRIVSMVAVSRDIPMYLLAAKTLYARIGHGRFVIIPDTPVPAGWRDRILYHLADAVEFVPLQEIDVGSCQRGGTWERLLTCLDWSERYYVVQMDSDTLTMGDIPEVRSAIAANRPFTLAENIPLQTLAEAAAWMDAERIDDAHVIDAAQRAFGRHPERARLRYIRGSSSFAGFAKGAANRRTAEAFHAMMEDLLGRQRWREWGTEQVASNFVVANSPDPMVLPWPDYASVVPDSDLNRIRFGHFMGTHRFAGQRFAKRGAALLKEMRA